MDIYEQKIVLKSWAEADQPREKLILTGRRNLTDAELVAILISSGNKEETAVDLSKRILAFYENDLDALAKASVKELTRFKGIGDAKAIAIVAALELSVRRKDIQTKVVHKVSSSRDAFNIVSSIFADLSHEEFWIILLNHANCVIGKQQISKGGVAGTLADPKIIFKIALEQKASNIILAHNHPSGNLKPSVQDLNLTRKLIAAGKILDLPVLDHLIVYNSLYYSFGDGDLL
ncbi:RadC family protein [Pedobacter metabolipauper]|uniref:DNA replication and repair protein RadC n=1 Tax=Pedobacter metabolipauper TaxID=425513 RepID=A0A4R6SSE4_9SPHI|nr:DNA repair protein RadC [Pedobacter metabolipauper]TDQ07458.1 DNA replication and repair protein RadC [Pedobacter metabolipauper]